MQVACRIKTLTEFFGKLGFRRSMWDLLVRARKVDGALVILNVSIDNVLVRTNSHILRTKVINHLKSYFPLRQKEGTAIKHLNCRTIQSKIHIPMDQTYHIMKMTTACFKTVKYLSTDTPFLTDRKSNLKFPMLLLTNLGNIPHCRLIMVNSLQTLEQHCALWFRPG